MNKLWIIIYLTMNVMIQSTSLYSYSPGIRHNRSYLSYHDRVQIDNLQKQIDVLQKEKAGLITTINNQQNIIKNLEKEVINLSQETNFLKKDQPQKIFSVLKVNDADTALQKINYLLDIQDQTKKIYPKVQVLTQKQGQKKECA